MSDLKMIYRELRTPIQQSGVILLILVLAIATAMVFYSRAQDDLQQSNQILQDSMNGFRKAMNDEHIMLTEKSRYEELRSRNFVGAEPRLQWIEDVRDIAQRADLVSIKYQLESRQPERSVAASANLQLYVSTMRLDLQLRHEGDLLSFLSILEGRNAGMFELKSCEIIRISDSDRFHLLEANLKAECVLRWYSMDKPRVFTEEML